MMGSTTLEPPDRTKALRACREALRRIANYELDPAIDRRMLDLGERKETLNAAEHAELLALIALTQRRTVEKLEAEVALQRLESAYPELATSP